MARRKRRIREESEEDYRARRAREASAAGNAFDRLLASGGLRAGRKRKKKKPSAKLIAARARNKAAQIEALMRRDDSLTPEVAEAKWEKDRAEYKRAGRAKQKAAALARKAAAIRNPVLAANYDTYLRSAHWIAKRKEAMEHYGSVCDQCGATSNLHVHHKTYARLCQEKMEDLQVLCKACHMALHEADPKWVARKNRREAG